MRPLLTFGIGMIARVLAMLAEHFSRWVFQQVSEGSEAGLDLLGELYQFCLWFLRMMASRLGGRRHRHHEEYDDELEAGYYPG